MAMKLHFVYLLVCFCSSDLLAEELIPRSILFANPQKTSPLISPDGTKLAYLASSNNIMNVWVRTVGKSDDTAVTSEKKRSILSFFWQADSTNILYLQDAEGDENDHVFQTNLSTKVTRDLTPFLGVNVQQVFVEPSIANQILVTMNLMSPRQHDVYRIDLKTGAVNLDTKNPGDVATFVANNMLQIAATESVTPEGGSEIRIRKTPKSPWKTLMRWGSDETFGKIIGFSKDNRVLRVISSVGANAARLIEVDTRSKKQTVVAQDKSFDVNSVLMNPRTKEIEGVSFLKDKLVWQFTDQSAADIFQILQRSDGGEIDYVRRDQDDTNWIVRFNHDNRPAHFYLFNKKTKKADFLFSDRPEIERYTLATMAPISFKARDGLTITGYLTLPPNHTKHLPMVVMVHQGPWGARDSWGYRSNVQWLANRGYAILQVNFRGSSGFGKKFLDAGDKEWGQKMQNDLIDGVNWAVEKGIADSKRVAIYGSSYGGYATLAGLAFTPEIFACGVDIFGISNLLATIKSLPPHWTPMAAVFKKRIGDIETEADMLKSRSPLYQAHRINAPVLVAQGANDPRVKQAESEQIVAAIRANKKPVEYLLFPDEGHGFVKQENRMAFYAAVENFLAKHLQGRSEPPTEPESNLLSSVKK